LPAVRINVTHGRATLRFLKEVPAIIGADMKTYGPFKVEDIAALPIENTKILIKQGLAEKLET
jgi:DNA replication initiation complex subunit (GINS family)